MNSAYVPQETLDAGASEAYNSYFVTLAQTLVAAGDGNAYLRIVWEFDGTWYAWRALIPGVEADYAEYFRQIVTAMRSVPGGSVRFVWNPQAMAFIKEGYSVTAAHPGYACVDDVGLDLYDLESGTVETEESTWADISLPSLSAAAAFASAHGKPIVMCEWGVFLEAGGRGPSDDPVYVTNMIA